MAKKLKNSFHGNAVPQNYDPLSGKSTHNAWRKVSKAGNYDSWLDYQKWSLGQVKPITRYKKGIK